MNHFVRLECNNRAVSNYLLSLRSGKIQSKCQRGLHGSAVVRSSDVTPTPAPKPPPGSTSSSNPTNPSVIEQPKIVPRYLDKIFLTWYGQYKSKDEIPSSVPGDTIHRARSYARIRINIGFLLLAAMLSGLMVWSGKRVQGTDSIEQRNLNWHKEINEQHRKETGGK